MVLPCKGCLEATDYFVGLVSKVLVVNGFTLSGLLIWYICTMASSAATSEPIEHSTIDNLAKTQEYASTPFAIQSINARDDLPLALLQVLSFQKMLNNTDDTDRHKLVLSNGTYMQLTILPSKYATLTDSDILKIGTIVQLSSYTCRYIWNTRTIVILSLEVKQSDCPFFGKPVQHQQFYERPRKSACWSFHAEQKKHTYRTNTVSINNTSNVYRSEDPFYMSQLCNKSLQDTSSLSHKSNYFHGFLLCLAFHKEQQPIHQTHYYQEKLSHNKQIPT
ncbi:hypothetical protein SUGI_1073250 [Cryptomeria japonica]|nr:hypothetical protein SUGI_1073250 [Cryptomeria japonica]